MKERSISVTEAARNFADCINRVRYQGLSFVLLKNGTPVARIVPESPVPAPFPLAETAVQMKAESAALPQAVREQPKEKVADTGEEIRRQSLQW